MQRSLYTNVTNELRLRNNIYIIFYNNYTMLYKLPKSAIQKNVNKKTQKNNTVLLEKILVRFIFSCVLLFLLVLNIRIVTQKTQKEHN